MSTHLIPELGAKGVFRFDAPFDSVSNVQTEFECVSVRMLTDVIASGVDVYNTYYKPYDIARSVYELHLDDNVAIIGFRPANGTPLYVPNPYLRSLPDASGVRYRMMILAVNIGAVADTTDLATVKALIEDSVFASLGIKPEIKEVAVSQPALVSNDEHDRIETARRNAISETPPVSIRLQNLLSQNVALLKKNESLVAYIRDKNNGTLPTTP